MRGCDAPDLVCLRRDDRVVEEQAVANGITGSERGRELPRLDVTQDHGVRHPRGAKDAHLLDRTVARNRDFNRGS